MYNFDGGHFIRNTNKTLPMLVKEGQNCLFLMI